MSEIIEERKRKVAEFIRKKTLPVYLALLAVIVWIASNIRTRNRARPRIIVPRKTGSSSLLGLTGRFAIRHTLAALSSWKTSRHNQAASRSAAVRDCDEFIV